MRHCLPRRFRWLLLLATLLVVPGAGRAPAAPQAGFVPPGQQMLRAREYLRFATSVQTGSILNAIAHMERDRSDPTYTAPVGALDADAWSNTWDKLDNFRDTRDFDGLYLVNALMGYEDHPYLTPALWDRVRSSLLEFKFWFTDPTPPLPDPADPERDWDNSIYWTENHQILYHTIEYLMGQRFPEACFTIRGFVPTADCSADYERRGIDHKTRARERILAWLDERWEIGFVEWHSNIYYQKDATPLLTLIEYADDAEIRERAAIVLDVLMMDLATHDFGDQLGATHGRTEMKDIHTVTANDTFGLVHLLFGQQDEIGHASTGEAGATLFARSKHYRLPRVIYEAAHSDERIIDRTRISVALDESAPLEDDPTPPPGTSFEFTPENFTFWWGLEAWTAWQVVPLTIRGAEEWNLWPTEFLEPFVALRNLLGPDPIAAIPVAKTIASNIWPQVALGVLSEVNTYTYRTADYMLSTAQDYRKGANSSQAHTWQATLGPYQMVFTGIPAVPVQLPERWVSRTDGTPGYWTGSGALPRSAQHENVAVHIYSPLYASNSLFGYEPKTHAYFPQDHFDEVVQEGHWTFGRYRDGYIALYSWRDTVWQAYTPEELAPLPPSDDGPIVNSFDLVAPGGPDNVWIVEMGSAARWGSFRAFVAAVLAAEVHVTPSPGTVPLIRTFEVAYTSPSQGEVHFGWEGPFRLRGQEVSLRGYPRMSNPWVHAERGDRVVTMKGRTGALRLDWDAGAREVMPAGGLHR